MQEEAKNETLKLTKGNFNGFRNKLNRSSLSRGLGIRRAFCVVNQDGEINDDLIELADTFGE